MGGPGLDPVPFPDSPYPSPAAPASPVAPSPKGGGQPEGMGATAASLAMRERALIEARYHRAMTNRRDIMQVRDALLKASARPKFAEGARYTIKRGGKTIQDLSIRAAEEVWRSYPNIDVTERVTHEDSDKLIVFVVVLDLETGSSRGTEVVVPKLVQRKFLKPGQVERGRTLNENNEPVYLVDATADDLRMQTGSLVARARRNLLLDLLPSDIREDFEEAVVRTLENEERQDPTAVRKRCADAFASFGISPQDVSQVLLDGTSIADCSRAQLAFLRSILTALREGATTWKEVKAEAAANAAGGQTTAAEAPGEAAPSPTPPPAGSPATAARVSAAINRTRKGMAARPPADLADVDSRLGDD